MTMDINHINEDGYTLLMRACKNNCIELVKTILKQYPDLNVQTKFGLTAFNIAVLSGNTDVVKLLIKTKKINIDRKDIFGQTPLVYACFYRFYDIVKVLLENGADVTVEYYGHTLLEFIKKDHNCNISKILSHYFSLAIVNYCNTKKRRNEY